MSKLPSPTFFFLFLPSFSFFSSPFSAPLFFFPPLLFSPPFLFSFFLLSSYQFTRAPPRAAAPPHARPPPPVPAPTAPPHRNLRPPAPPPRWLLGPPAPHPTGSSAPSPCASGRLQFSGSSSGQELCGSGGYGGAGQATDSPSFPLLPQSRPQHLAAGARQCASLCCFVPPRRLSWAPPEGKLWKKVDGSGGAGWSHEK